MCAQCYFIVNHLSIKIKDIIIMPMYFSLLIFNSWATPGGA